MITRSKMRRQLYRGGGIADLYPRQKYGIGSWVKERVRKLIPNELADVAVKAAPFVAPFQPGIAAMMRGIGRFDQRGSISDALKQGVGTYVAGDIARGALNTQALGSTGESRIMDAISERLPKGVSETAGRIKDRVTGGVENIFKGGTQPAEGTSGIGKGLSDFAKEKLLVGTVSGGLTYIYEKFIAEEPEQQPGETYGEFLARRKRNVAQKMRAYKDNYHAFDADWNELSDEEKDAQINTELSDYDVQDANMNQGGRVGYQFGGISMSNTLAENIRRNQAQAAANQGVLAAARDRLTMAFDPKTRSQARSELFGQGYGNVEAPFRPSPDIEPEAPALPTLTQDYYDQLEALRTKQKAAGITDENLIPDFGAVGEGIIDLGMPGIPTAAGQKEKLDYLTSGVNQGLTYDQIMGNYMDKQRDSFTADINKYGSFADGRTIDPIAGRSSYQDLVRVFQNDYPNVQLTGNETLAELDQMMLDLQDQQGYNQGGRVGLRHGTPEEGIKSLDVGAPDITYEGNEGPQAPQEEKQMASGTDYVDMYSRYAQDIIRSGGTPMSIEDFIEIIKKQEGKTSRGPVLPSPEDPINPWTPKPTGPVLPDKQMAAQGGRIGQMYGTGPQGLPGIPRRAPDGMEFDMRQNGGFQGLGAKEGKDDVPAMLAKNEFVFTADAVRGAGGGDIELGAQRMYDTMKNLERRMA